MKNNQPNIVMITCDHLRGDFLGCAGHDLIQTPHIDLLAKKGVRFTQAYSTTPICTPARATIMTGLDGNSIGLTEYQEGRELPVKETLPQQLSDAGYQTLVVGKMHTYPERRHYGFNNMILCEEGRALGAPYGEKRGYGDYEQWLSEQGYPGMAFGHGMSINSYTTTSWHLPDHLHPTEWIGYEACKQIKRRDWTSPLFLWASFTAPHPPLTPLLKDLHLYDRDEMPTPVIGDWTEEHPIFHELGLSFGETMTEKQIDLAYRAYFALVTQVDRQVNRIIGTLREEEILDNTWFIFTSDHGDNLGDHNLWQKTNFLKGSCNIPLIITPPLVGRGDESRSLLNEEWLPGEVNDSVVALQDILPTCCEIAGAKIPENIDGKSLVPLVDDANQAVRDVLLGEFGSIGKRSLMVSDGKWKYIWYEEDGVELLFNLQEDPDELHNAVLEEPQLTEQWRGKMISLIESRESDPAVVNGQLCPIAPGVKLSSMEKEIRKNSYPYFHPMGLRM